MAIMKKKSFIAYLGPSFSFPSVLSAYFLSCGCTNYGTVLSSVILLVAKMAIMTKQKSFPAFSLFCLFRLGDLQGNFLVCIYRVGIRHDPAVSGSYRNSIITSNVPHFPGKGAGTIC